MKKQVKKISKRTKVVKVLDLTKDKNCYCYYLNNNLDYLRKAAFGKTISLDHYKSIVGYTIKPAKWTNKRTEFAANFNALDTKEEIYYYIKNSVNKAKNYIEK